MVMLYNFLRLDRIEPEQIEISHRHSARKAASVGKVVNGVEAMKLSSSVQAFVLHFGEMGSRWGINRTVGQIYALLYLSKDPLNADQITESLGISRSNTSMGLKELQAWRLVRLQHFPADRREYFSTPEDITEIALTLVEERRKRELDPTMTLLRQTLMEPPIDSAEEHAHDRMQQMCDLMELVSKWSHRFSMASGKNKDASS